MLDYLQTILGGLAGIAATGVVTVFRQRTRWKAFDEFLADWNGVSDRPGVPGRKGVMVRLADLESGQADRDRVQLAQATALEQIARRLDESGPPDVPHQRAAS